MLSKQPIGDMWSLPDNDPHSQHYGESLDFDFSYIHSEEMKSVVKDYIWHSVFESATEKEWFQEHKHKGAALCDGYCTKPFEPGAVCDRLLKRQKCYSCSRYITTPEYLDAHRSHLERLERQLIEGAIYGEHYAEHGCLYSFDPNP